MGAVVTQVNPMYVEREIAHILQGSGAETIVVYAGAYPRVKSVLAKTSVRNVVVVAFGGEPEETEAALRDGWLYTGDVARMEDDGYFYIVDRTKDMIVASGYNVYPREIEEVLYEHPSVAEAVAIGIPDEYRGES